MSFDGESAWSQYDPHIVVPKEWGKQGDNWKGRCAIGRTRLCAYGAGDLEAREHEEVALHRVPKYDRTGIEINL